MTSSPSIAIIGAGFGGLATAIKLKAAEIDSITIYEKAERVGGTWHYNSYPGCACDVPVQLYSFSFEQNATWSYVYARNDEIQSYCEHVAETYGLTPHLKLRTSVTSATWDPSRAKWRVTLEGGETADFDIVVSSMGQLNNPAFPEIAGRESFAGPAFHSARWRHDIDLKGKKVGVIGNAASAAQFIPEIAKDVGALTIFQRAANYLLPRNDRAFGDFEKKLFKFAPWILKARRNQTFFWAEWMFFGAFDPSDWRSRLFLAASRQHLEAQISDPVLREKLWPTYPIGCKRIIFSDDYYPALNQANVSLVTDPIEQIDAQGVVTKSGKQHAFDVLIYGTGFETSSFNWSVDIVGRRGKRLKDAWKDGPEAYFGIATQGFPNFFMTYGPNTNLGHNSIIAMIESQADYIAQCAVALRDQNLGSLEVRAAAQEEFNTRLQAALAGTSWAGACGSWYKNASGKITNNWMGDVRSYRRETRTANLNDFELHPRIDYSLIQSPATPPLLSPEQEGAEAPP